MVKIYSTDIESNKFSEVNDIKKGCWINMVSPTQEEIAKTCESINIDDEFMKYALDFEEKARIDIEDDITLFIIDVPIIEEDEDEQIYTTMPLAMMVVRDDYFITVSLRENEIIRSFENGRMRTFATYKKSRFVLQILYKNAEFFLSYLKKINKETEKAEDNLRENMQNKELLKMLSLKKSLVYFTTSLRSNEAVMEKTMRGKIVKLYEEDEDLLEDAIVENRQAIEMCKINNDILAGTMDVYSSIISNNLNSVMKFLTSITIVLSIPTMIASFWGMNVPLPFDKNPLGFIIMISISIVIAVVCTWLLKKKDLLD